MHPKKVGLHAYTPQKRQKIGVQQNVHQVIWCTLGVYTNIYIRLHKWHTKKNNT
jgi:hypothetical protein